MNKGKATLPPRLAHRILHWFLREDLAEEVAGDLDEKFFSLARTKSLRRARLNYWYQVVNYIRPFAIRKARAVTHINQYDMLQNYIKTGFRNLLKSKFFSVINISGMALSMAVFFTIALYVHDEFSFDKELGDADLKFRIYSELFSDDGSSRKAAMVPPPIAPTLVAEYPQVEYYARFLNFNTPPLFEVGDKRFTEDRGGAADPGIFEMFDLKLTEGNRRQVLTEPNTIAINETLKNKYFPDKPALGESIEIFDQPFKVVAVFENFSERSHFQMNYFMAMDGIVEPERMQRWGWSQFHTYVKLRAGADWKELESHLKGFAEKYAWPVTKPDGGYYIPHLMPVRDIHLRAYDQLWDVAIGGNIQTIYILTAVAGFILLIAILNFVNLSTARAVNRAKEVGVRKVMGAFRGQLMIQFVSESVMIALMALVIAGFATEASLPYLNSFTGKSIPQGILLEPMVLAALFAFAVFTGIMAGVYPAFYLSRNKPASILSHRDMSGGKKAYFRQALVAFQFVLSFFLIIASLVVSQQHAFMRESDMGFEKENLIVLPVQGEMSKNFETTRQSFSGHPGVESVSFGYGLPGQAYAGDGIIDKASSKRWNINMLTVDHDYVKTLGLEVIAGRDFSREIATDVEHAFILSEAGARMLGYSDPAEAVGHELAWDRWDQPDSLKEGRVIGIVRDIQLNSMRENIAPVILQIYPFAWSTMTVRVEAGNLPSTIAHLEKQWQAFNSEWPFEYRFLDENFDRMYKAEENLSVLFKIFTGFTIFVACLGLFGLVVYSTTQRYREVSIRKVLGATEAHLVKLLAGNYVILLAIAFAIAIPLSFMAANQWLKTFVFHISLTPLLFIKAAFLIVGIALVTVGVQSYRATRTNPVEALKEQ